MTRQQPIFRDKDIGATSSLKYQERYTYPYSFLML